MKRQDFFRRVFQDADGLVEIRCLPSCKQLFKRKVEEIENFLRQHCHENIYCGAATRKRESGKKEDVLSLVALWADLDFKDFRGGRDEVRQKLGTFDLEPSITIASGGGYQPWWILKEPIPADIEHEQYLKGIAFALSADPAAAEIARVLRVPETFNYKYNPPRRTRVVFERDRHYDLRQFDRWKLTAITTEPSDCCFTEAAVEIYPESFNLSSKILELILNGSSHSLYRSRSEADQAVIVALLRSGATDDEIRAVFKKYPIGEKYREKEKQADTYLAYSIGKGKTFLSSRS